MNQPQTTIDWRDLVRYYAAFPADQLVATAAHARDCAIGHYLNRDRVGGHKVNVQPSVGSLRDARVVSCGSDRHAERPLTPWENRLALRFDASRAAALQASRLAYPCVSDYRPSNVPAVFRVTAGEIVAMMRELFGDAAIDLALASGENSTGTDTPGSEQNNELVQCSGECARDPEPVVAGH